jgi:CRISPR-associated endonuclease/helicase Cas3
MDFSEWFTKVTGHVAPRDWQSQLAADARLQDRLVSIPTGFGKTEGILAAWSFHRVLNKNEAWPRRLVWCLPMRVLVEQTAAVARGIADRIRQLSGSEDAVRVHTLMGGERSRHTVDDWCLYPELPAILIGTQDMLLSRAMNRGYGASRARWPMEFGLLNQDALWVMDEVQLMDVGLATSAQLQAFRRHDEGGGRRLRPCHTWWMSATLQPEWLRTVDTAAVADEWMRCRTEPGDNDRKSSLWQISKAVSVTEIAVDEHKKFAELVQTQHNALPRAENGRITLVVCNTVDRACRTFEALQRSGSDVELQLVHSRFRPAERKAWREQFLSRAACDENANRIIVATQVVEAGVDISAGSLITELAPWTALIQRFGRCARYGGDGQIVVVNRGLTEKTCKPYELSELTSSWRACQQIEDGGVGSLEDFERSQTEAARRELYPYRPANLLLRREFDELFDTTADLTGADLDISRFIRSGDERDLQVFWADIPKDQRAPADTLVPSSDELCSVPFLLARDWLCGTETSTKRNPRLRNRMRAWVWDWLDGQWVEVTRATLLPGRVICVAAQCGGYRASTGFTPEAVEPVSPVAVGEKDVAVAGALQGDTCQDDDTLSQVEHWKTIACHSDEVRAVVGTIGQQLGLCADLLRILDVAAEWHDAGKSHSAFQARIRSDRERPARNDLAKAPRDYWLPRGAVKPVSADAADGSTTVLDHRPGFRHELASVLALYAVLEAFAPEHAARLGDWFEFLGGAKPQQQLTMTVSDVPQSVQRLLGCSAEEFNLVAWLIGTHHGKVRLSLQASPNDQDYRDLDHRGLPIRGVREHDRLPAIAVSRDGGLLPELTLRLDPASIGLSPNTGPSWRDRGTEVLRRFGPCGLAYLEAIMRAADRRASQLLTSDPALQGVVR